MSDQKIIVCVPTSYDPVVGEKVSTCAKCGADIRLAPSSMPMIAAGAIAICVTHLEELEGEIELEPITDEQLAEVAKHFAERN